MKLRTSRDAVSTDPPDPPIVLKGWEKTINEEDASIHIHPINDAIVHQLYIPGCSCHAKIRYLNGWSIITHHSFDGRELREQGKPTN